MYLNFKIKKKIDCTSTFIYTPLLSVHVIKGIAIMIQATALRKDERNIAAKYRVRLPRLLPFFKMQTNVKNKENNSYLSEGNKFK